MRKLLGSLFLLLFIVQLMECWFPSEDPVVRETVQKLQREAKMEDGYGYGSKVVIDDQVYDIKALVEKSRGAVVSIRALAFESGRLWIVYIREDVAQGGANWVIATMDLKTGSVEERHSAQMSQDNKYLVDGLGTYGVFKSNPERYELCAATWNDRRIILSDRENVIEYNVDTGEVRTTDYAFYRFPQLPLAASVSNEELTVSFYTEAEEKSLNTDDLLSQSAAFATVWELKDHKVKDADAFSLDQIFGAVRETEHSIYLICQVQECYDEWFYLLFDYDFSENRARYLGSLHEYDSDKDEVIIPSHLYFFEVE